MTPARAWRCWRLRRALKKLSKCPTGSPEAIKAAAGVQRVVSKIIGPTKGTYITGPSLTERVDMTLNGIAPKIPCTNANTDCDYPEPHHHGFACSTTCPCGKGAHRPVAGRVG